MLAVARRLQCPALYSHLSVVMIEGCVGTGFSGQLLQGDGVAPITFPYVEVHCKGDEHPKVKVEFLFQEADVLVVGGELRTHLPPLR